MKLRQPLGREGTSEASDPGATPHLLGWAAAGREKHSGPQGLVLAGCSSPTPFREGLPCSRHARRARCANGGVLNTVWGLPEVKAVDMEAVLNQPATSCFSTALVPAYHPGGYQPLADARIHHCLPHEPQQARSSILLGEIPILTCLM